MGASNVFVVEGIEFEQSALKLKPSLAAEALVLETALPAILAVRSEYTGDISPALAGFAKLDQLVDIFAAVCKVRRSCGLSVALPPFLDETFERRNAALLVWLVECIEWQFADFFGGNGPSLLAERVSRLSFLRSSTGASGA
jgi:hypothetical protein